MENWITRRHSIEKKKSLNSSIKAAEGALKSKYLDLKKIVEHSYQEACEELKKISEKDLEINREQRELEQEMRDWKMECGQYNDIFSLESSAEFMTPVSNINKMFEEKETRILRFVDKLSKNDDELIDKMKAMLLMDK